VYPVWAAVAIFVTSHCIEILLKGPRQNKHDNHMRKVGKILPFQVLCWILPALIEMQFSAEICPIKSQDIKIETNLNWVNKVCYMFRKKKEISLV
jgi:hypothetical protein